MLNSFILCNKYANWYFSLMGKAKSRSKPNDYTERHHIIPKSLGGTDNDDNLVHLTAREHYTAHKLLYNSSFGEAKKKMFWAWHKMTSKNTVQKRIFINSREFEQLRKLFLYWNSGPRNSNYGKRFKKFNNGITERCIPVMKLDKARSELVNTGFEEGGLALSIERKVAISKIHKGTIWMTDGITNFRISLDKLDEFEKRGAKRGRSNCIFNPKAISKKTKGKKKSEEHNIKNSKSHKGSKNHATGKKWFNNGIIQRLYCPTDLPDGFVSGKLPVSDETKSRIKQTKAIAKAEGRLVPWNKGKTLSANQRKNMGRPKSII